MKKTDTDKYHMMALICEISEKKIKINFLAKQN